MVAEMTDVATLTNSLPIRMVTINRRGFAQHAFNEFELGISALPHLLQLNAVQREHGCFGA